MLAVPALIYYHLFQVKSPHEDLGEIVFTKYVMSAHHEAAGVVPEKGYIECSQYQLSQALHTCLALYNANTQQQLDLVFFREAAQHITRITRVLVRAFKRFFNRALI